METNEVKKAPTGNDALASWVMSKVDRWRTFRDANYLDDWNKYYNLWRGKWNESLKNKNAERSRLIAPALQQAIDQTVAEESEAIFGKGKWIDIRDDLQSNDYQKASILRDQLLDDFKRADVAGAVRECLQLGALYGTGIAKAMVDEVVDWKIDTGSGDPAEKEQTKFLVTWQAIPPDNFVIDPSALTIAQALGVAHETIRPRHIIEKRQRDGVYRNVAVGGMSGTHQTLGYRSERGEIRDISADDGVYITEYHGLVPVKFVEDKEEQPQDPLAQASDVESSMVGGDDGVMVEAIVTIANGGTLLRKVVNPILTRDRAFIAFSHDKVPGRFWGRGVAEKGFNSQVALDSELRARIDALGLMTYPVIGADATRLPRNLNLQITPGKALLTNGRPSEVIEPIVFGNLQPATFQQTGDLERMVQMATGSVDTATPIDVNTKNSTASGVSMQQGAVLKRAKLTMQNIDEFLNAMVRKSLIRYMQFDPERYPMDLDFVVDSTMSIMAREFEQAQMTNLLAVIPAESPAYLVVLKAIVENYGGPSKGALVAAVDNMLKPNPEAQKVQQMQQQMQMQLLMNEVQKGAREIQKIEAEIMKIKAQTQSEVVDAELAPIEAQAKVAAVVVQNKQADNQSHKNMIDAHKAVSDRKKAEKSGTTSTNK